jgi:hypothetical protein
MISLVCLIRGTGTATTRRWSGGERMSSTRRSVIEEWNMELKKENDGKVGEPYHYPESYIRLLAFVRLLFHMPYRETEGFVHFLSKHIKGLKVPDYSTIDRRTNRLDVRLDETLVKSNSPVTIAVDGSGIKVTTEGTG